jgi:hypothetical protein
LPFSSHFVFVRKPAPGIINMGSEKDWTCPRA